MNLQSNIVAASNTAFSGLNLAQQAGGAFGFTVPDRVTNAVNALPRSAEATNQLQRGTSPNGVDVGGVVYAATPLSSGGALSKISRNPIPYLAVGVAVLAVLFLSRK